MLEDVPGMRFETGEPSISTAGKNRQGGPGTAKEDGYSGQKSG
jgi:hypothetical protein